MRSFVVEPMQHGRLFLAGDAAHIVPPTGAKGLNLAVADVRRSRPASRPGTGTATSRCWSTTRRRRYGAYGRRVLLLVHDLDAPTGAKAATFDVKLRLAQLAYVCGSETAAASLAENYVGLEQV